MIYLKEFATAQDYEAYTADTANFVTPNVSLIEETHGVAYHPAEPTPTETIVVATFNVTDTSSPTPIGNTQYTSGFSAIEIDGVEQPSVVSAYTFNTTGEHTVKYTLADPTSIGDSAFYNCSSLTSIAIPSGVTSIGNWAFNGCSGLTSIDIPSGVTSIGNWAFSSCSGLTSVTIPNSVTSIKDGAFAGCISLPVENNIRYADTYAIEVTNTNLTTYTLKAGTRFIGDEAFAGCDNLTSINIPDSVISIGNNAFDGCFRLPVENNIRYADTYAVVVTDMALTTYTLKAGTKFIGTDAFAGCDSLTSINIPDSVTSIGENAFGYCYSLTSIEIPSGVTSIGKDAFQSCTGLQSITIEREYPPTLGRYAFYDTNNCPIYVPSGSVNAYKSATNWSEYAGRIQAIP